MHSIHQYLKQRKQENKTGKSHNSFVVKSSCKSRQNFLLYFSSPICQAHILSPTLFNYFTCNQLRRYERQVCIVSIETFVRKPFLFSLSSIASIVKIVASFSSGKIKCHEQQNAAFFVFLALEKA